MGRVQSIAREAAEVVGHGTMNDEPLKPIDDWRIETENGHSWYVSIETGRPCMCGNCMLARYKGHGTNEDVGSYEFRS